MRPLPRPLVWVVLATAVGCGRRAVRADDARVDSAVTWVGDAMGPEVRVNDARPEAPPRSLTERVLRACAFSVSCGGFTDSGWSQLAASRCVDRFALIDWPRGGYAAFGPSPELYERLLGCAEEAIARGGPDHCRSFYDCFGGDWIIMSRCPEFAVCHGNQIAVPSAEMNLSFDCGSVGGTCTDLFTGAPRACCGVGHCDSDAVRCRGAEGTLCLLGMPFDFDCGPTGRVCTESIALCAGTGEPCPTDRGTTCAGTEATFCSAERLATYDCAKNPFRGDCDRYGFEMPCGASGGECGPDFSGECANEADLVTCVDGRRVTIDCREIGFEICYRPSETRPARCGMLLGR